jgi:hypothetical protein
MFVIMRDDKDFHSLSSWAETRPPRGEVQLLSKQEKERRLDEVLKSKSSVSNSNSLFGNILRRESTNPTAKRSCVEQRRDYDTPSTQSSTTRNRLLSATESRDQSPDQLIFCGIMSFADLCVVESLFGRTRKEAEGRDPIESNIIVQPSAGNQVCRNDSQKDRSRLESQETRDTSRTELHPQISSDPASKDSCINPSMELVLDSIEETPVKSKRRRKGSWKRKKKQKKPSKGPKRKKKRGYTFGVIDL